MPLRRRQDRGHDRKLRQTWLPGRGLILAVRPWGATVQIDNGVVGRICTFAVQVMLEGRVPYKAACRQGVPESQIPQFHPGSTVVAVQVNPKDPSKVVLDLRTDPPAVSVARDPNTLSTATLLETGTPARGVIVEFQPLGWKNAEGADVYALALTVIPDRGNPYLVKIGNPAPATASPLLFPGSRVPVKVGTDPHAVVVDWAQARAERAENRV